MKNISENEEITISYINNNVPKSERYDALLQYGFECKCEKCGKGGKVEEVSERFFKLFKEKEEKTIILLENQKFE